MEDLLFPPPDPLGVPRTYTSLFDQGKWWKSQDGWIKVKHMTPAHRDNAAALLMRKACTMQMKYELSLSRLIWDAPDDVFDSLMYDRHLSPERWLAGTKLYRSLTKPRKK